MPRYAVIDSAQRPYFYERLDRLGASDYALLNGSAMEKLRDV